MPRGRKNQMNITGNTKITNEKDWLKARKSGIGGSEVAAILGLSPYKTNIELWEEKTGRREPKDLSDNPFVQYGKKAEEHLRALFALDFPEYEISYDKYKIFRNPEYPFILATLDGYLTDYEKGRQGVLEIKTAEIIQPGQWQKWKDQIPQVYYCQCIHQLLATGFDFVILKAQLKSNNKGNIRIDTRHYTIERSDVKEDMEYLKAKEIEFWTQYIEKDVMPPLQLPNI